MKCVGVRHKPEHKNIVWFLVPELLEPITQIGSQVICGTKKDEMTGVVISIREGVDSEEENIKNFFKCYILKKILQPRRNLIFLIFIFHYIWSAHLHLLIRLQRELMSSTEPGVLKRRLFVALMVIYMMDTQHILLLKMFGHDTLTVFCVNQL